MAKARRQRGSSKSISPRRAPSKSHQLSTSSVLRHFPSWPFGRRKKRKPRSFVWGQSIERRAKRECGQIGWESVDGAPSTMAKPPMAPPITWEPFCGGQTNAKGSPFLSFFSFSLYKIWKLALYSTTQPIPMFCCLKMLIPKFTNFNISLKNAAFFWKLV